MDRIELKDKDLQTILGNLLRIGVIISMVIVLIGGALYLVEYRGTSVNYGMFTPETSAYSSIGPIIEGVGTLHGGAIIQFGVLLLIFTPIMRIVFSVISFIIERDYMYVIIGLIVLAVIGLSLGGGLAG